MVAYRSHDAVEEVNNAEVETSFSLSALDSFVRYSYREALDTPDPLSPISPETLCFPIYLSPTVPISLPLTTVESEYFEYYCCEVAPTISVVPNHLNYFLQVFLPLAYSDQLVLYCLVAWGYIFRYKQLKQNNPFLARARQLLSKNNHNFITSLASYIILMCIEITTGDTMAWSRYLTNCYDSINAMGGFGVMKNYSEQGKVLAENFAYFDILASQSNENGTYYPVYEYDNLFNMVNTGGFVDPLLGCTRPLILILGDVINLVVETKALKENPCYTDVEKLEKALTKANAIETKLKKAKIFTLDYQILAESNNDEMSYHQEMFELYRLTIQMYMNQTIRRLPPIVPEMQLLLGKATAHMSSLVDSPLRLGLTFPLLVTGMNSVTEKERDLTSLNIKLIGVNYEFESIGKLERVIREVWDLNPAGILCIDYFEVTKKFGWKLNIGR